MRSFEGEGILRRTSHLTPHTSHLTPHTSHLIPHTSHLTLHTQRANSLFADMERRATYLMNVLRRKKKSHDVIELSPTCASASGTAPPFVSQMIAFESHTSHLPPQTHRLLPLLVRFRSLGDDKASCGRTLLRSTASG